MLTGKKVKLMAVQKSDREILYGWINDAELVRFNAPYRPVEPEEHAAWFDGLHRDPSRVVFAVRDICDERLIGLVQLIDINPVHRSAEMVIRIGSAEHRGRGCGSETLVLLLDFAWRDLNLHRVMAHVFADNNRAIVAYRKVGFAEEGRLREAAFIDGQWKDVIVMAALSGEAGKSADA